MAAGYIVVSAICAPLTLPAIASVVEPLLAKKTRKLLIGWPIYFSYSVGAVRNHPTAQISLISEFANQLCHTVYVVCMLQCESVYLVVRQQKSPGNIITKSLYVILWTSAANASLP